MKKKLEKVLSLLFVFTFIVMGCSLMYNIAKADTTTDDANASTAASNAVKIYYYNAENWETVNIWAWTMGSNTNLAKNAWPGDVMKDEGNGWFSAEITSDDKIGLLFTDSTDKQTSDCQDLELGKTYWITNGSEDSENSSGLGGGVSLTAVTEPKAGWPEGPAAEEATTTTKTTATEKTNSNKVVLYVIIAVAIVVIVAVIVVINKKKKTK